jgi:phosphoribosylamine--glycine ligase
MAETKALRDLGRHNLKILVVGGGGREHALCWKIAQSAYVEQVFCAPGNGGTTLTEKVQNVPISAMDFDGLANFSSKEQIDLVVVGPDNPLAEGIVDHLQGKHLRVFGPTRQAAKIEWSKAHAKAFMKANGIPTPNFVVASKLSEAKTLFQANPWARVVKVDGLALGKGVYVCDTESDVLAACQVIFEENRFGEAGKVVLLEERVIGEEISLLLLCDGKTILPLASSQDYKRRFDHDQGPNTGGMGAVSPVPIYEKHEALIVENVLKPIRDALANGSLEFQGLLYAGIIIAETKEGAAPMVLEFNARFGDPETQAILPRLESDLVPALWACTNQTLDQISLNWSDQASCCIVAVSDGYPDKASNGEAINIGVLPQDCVLYHAGTKQEREKTITAGGRVLSITGLAPNVMAAAKSAYAGLKSVNFAGMDYRRDIARERSLCR